MRTSDTPRLSSAAPAQAAPTAVPPSAAPALTSPDVAAGPAGARFAAEGRSIAAGVTARGPSTIAVPGKKSPLKLDAVSLCELARNSISGGTFKATIPMREGQITMAIGKSEPAEMAIDAGTVCTCTARIIPSAKGLQLTDVEMSFSKPLRMGNPGIIFGGALVSALARVDIYRMRIDGDGQLHVQAKARAAVFSKEMEVGPGVLPIVPLNLERFLQPGKAPGIPKVPTLDPRQLIAAIGGSVEKATFDLMLEGPKQSVAVGSDGAEIIAREGRGSLKLKGELKSDGQRTLAGNVSGEVNAGLAIALELCNDDVAVRSNGMTLMGKDGRLHVNVGDLEIRRAFEGPLAAVIGDHAVASGAITGDLKHQIAIRFGRDGSLNIALKDIEANLDIKAGTVKSSRFQVGLGQPSTAGFKLAELSAGETGYVARGADGRLHLQIAEGETDLRGHKQSIKDGRVAIGGTAESVDGKVTAMVNFDIPLESELPNGKHAKSRARGQFETEVG